MTLKLNYHFALLLIFMISSLTEIKAQKSENNLNKTILELDAKFWEAYNSCDLKTIKTLFTDDIEFYHDKGGLTETLLVFMKQIAENVCGKPNMTLRRESVENSVKVYPLNNYGAIISGDHVFYVKEGNTKERLVEQAKFTHIWKLKDGQWKMSRALSYDHQPISENTSKKEIVLNTDELSIYIGNYEAPKTGAVKIFLSEEGKLTMSAGQMQAELYSEKENIFFIKEAPLVFEFVKNKEGKVIKFMVMESGNKVEEATKIN